VVTRAEPGRFDALLSETDVERLVCSTGIRYPAFRLVKEGEGIGLHDYTVDVPWRPEPFTATADVDRVVAEFEAGATIVLQGLHLNWEPLAVFCRELERELGHSTQANAYYTPRDSKGLAVHHDTHDVFVLQVSGEKRWLVYEPVFPLPLKRQRYKKELGAPGAAVHDIVLRPGDTLYLPRGWLHEAVTSATDSLHVTVGVNVYTWIDAFKGALADCEQEEAFRRSVPDDGEGAGDLLARLRGQLDPDLVAGRRRQRFLATRRPIREGQLTQVRALARLGLETELERRPTVLAELDGATLTFEGRRLGFPPQVVDELEFIIASDGPFRAADLPGQLDEEGRLVLVRRLVREGFLLVSEPARGGPSRGSDGRAAE
jgi:bifunctional lysine-specific demethylase and histidyl-hydroxylase NO66